MSSAGVRGFHAFRLGQLFLLLELLLLLERLDLFWQQLLYDAFAAEVYGISISMTGSVTVAQDITRAVFLGVWRNPNTVFGHHQHLGEHRVRIA